MLQHNITPTSLTSMTVEMTLFKLTPTVGHARTVPTCHIKGFHARSSHLTKMKPTNFTENSRGKGKVLLYSLLSVGPKADPSVQAVNPQVTISHLPVVGCHYFPPGLSFTFVSIHQMAPPLFR